MRIPVGILLLLAGVWLRTAPVLAESSAVPSRPGEAARPELPARFENLNLPSPFFQLIKERAAIDNHLLRELQVEPGPAPAPVAPRLIRSRNPQGVRRLDPFLPPETQRFRAAFPQSMSPLRGFRAPILEEATNWFPLLDRANHLTPTDREAMQLINRRLAFDGLLSTLAQVLELLGPATFAASDAAGLIHLRALGFPDDLLACFARRNDLEPAIASLEVVQWIAGKLTNGDSARTLAPQLAQRPFLIPSRWSQFQIASESGDQELGRLRLQVGGGFTDGIVPGESIHVIAQLVAGLPQADLVISVPEDVIQPFQLWASQALPLRRPGQVTLITAPGRIETWAQDNGKAGQVRDPQTHAFAAAVVAPRYASRQEGQSHFLPSESFLTDGLESAGLKVVHHPLLFQGGNLMAVTDPGTGRRTLLVGEGEVHRNIALGLRPDQIIEAFRAGLGVDACVVIPTVSYHLDFDMNVRAIGGKLVAFVNDPMPAVEMILGLGIDTLERHGLIEPPEAVALRYDLSGNGGCLALDRLSELMTAGRGPDGVHRSSLAAMFKRNSSDSGAGNLQVFLQALTLLESELTGVGFRRPDAAGQEALQALQAMNAARHAQQAALSKLGWRIVKIPSLPNLFRSINYLNGIHHQSGYVMPAYGGFYAALDAAAENVFQTELGPDARILRIQCDELQRKHGAVHCAAVAHPPATKEAGNLQPVAGF